MQKKEVIHRVRYSICQWRSQGGRGASCSLAPLPEGMAPLVGLVRRPPAGGAGGKIGGRSKKKVVKKLTYMWRSKKNFMPPLGRNPGSATDLALAKQLVLL
jgi:hypothetical protein